MQIAAAEGVECPALPTCRPRKPAGAGVATLGGSTLEGQPSVELRTEDGE